MHTLISVLAIRPLKFGMLKMRELEIKNTWRIKSAQSVVEPPLLDTLHDVTGEPYLEGKEIGPEA